MKWLEQVRQLWKERKRHSSSVSTFWLSESIGLVDRRPHEKNLEAIERNDAESQHADPTLMSVASTDPDLKDGQAIDIHRHVLSKDLNDSSGSSRECSGNQRYATKAPVEL